MFAVFGNPTPKSTVDLEAQLFEGVLTQVGVDAYLEKLELKHVDIEFEYSTAKIIK